MAENNNDNPTHIVYQEFVCPDGYISTKVALNPIRFLDPDDLEARIFGGRDSERYNHYSELIHNGHYANGVPIVYRSPKGIMFASDIRHSDIAIYAEKNVKVHASVPRNPVHPLISVKIIEVASLADIAVQRQRYLDGHPPSKIELLTQKQIERIDAMLKEKRIDTKLREPEE